MAQLSRGLRGGGKVLAVKFQGLTAAAAAAFGMMLSALAQGNTGDQDLAYNPHNNHHHPFRRYGCRQFGATKSGTSNGPSGG